VHCLQVPDYFPPPFIMGSGRDPNGSSLQQ
jgi:hypothetical protein